MKSYVITGASSCGKTTLINYLRDAGFLTVPETARGVLEEGAYHPSRDPFLFQQEIARRQSREEDAVRNGEGKMVFLDRGFFDQIAFCRHTGVKELPPEIRTNAHYDAVFLLEKLSLFESDGVRVEKDASEAEAIEKMVMEEYEKRNIPIVRVPAVSVGERAEYILRFTQDYPVYTG